MRIVAYPPGKINAKLKTIFLCHYRNFFAAPHKFALLHPGNYDIVINSIPQNSVLGKDLNTMEDKKTLKKNLIMFPLGTVGRDMIYNPELFTEGM